MTLESFTNGQLFSLSEPLKQLANVDVPARVGIKIARLIRVLIKEVDPITEVRNKLFTKYGEKDEKGFHLTPESPNWGKFTEEHDALMNQVTKVEFEKVLLPEDVRVDVKVLIALEPFLEVEAAPASHNGVAKNVPVMASRD